MANGKRQTAKVVWLCAALATSAQAKEVLAFYYGWYGTPQTASGKWVHWQNVDTAAKTIGSSTNFPALWPYDSHDPKLLARHAKQAKDAGITGFIVSWWAQGDFHDQGMPLILEAARKAGLKITVYFETVKPRGAPAVEGAVKDVMYLLEQYGKHPAWLRVEGKPVLFVYGRAVGEIRLDGWQSVIEQVHRRHPAVFIGDQISERSAQVFDGIHTYNPTGRIARKSLEDIRAWAKETYPKWVETAGKKISCVTIIPGYDDSKLGRPNPRPITDRHNSQTYRALWEQAISAKPDWVLITSWNEWHEGSEIEPSIENGDRELKTTREFARKFRTR